MRLRNGKVSNASASPLWRNAPCFASSQVHRCKGERVAPGHRIRCTGAGIPIVKSRYTGTGSPGLANRLEITGPMESNTHE